MKEILLNYKFYMFLAALFFWYKTVNTVDAFIRCTIVYKYTIGQDDNYAVSLDDFFGGNSNE